MAQGHSTARRVFKSAWFAKAAKKACISDEALCEAIAEVMNGQCDDLGGGVFKKRLNRNMHRAVVLSKSRSYWVYEYLFAKKDRDNIEDDELCAFRSLAKAYSGITEAQLVALLSDKHLMEICNADEKKIQR